MAQKILTTLCPASPAQFEPKLVHHKGTTVHHILVYRLGQHQCSAQGHQRLLRGRPRLLPLLTGHRGLGCWGHSESCDERNQPLRGHVWLGNWDCWIDRRWGNGRSGTRAKRQGQARVPAPTSQPFLPPNHPPSNSYQFPGDVGISTGMALDPQWVRLEIHYSNLHSLPGERLEHLRESGGEAG